MLYALRLISIVFVALALIPAGSHIFSLANKIGLDRESYRAAQRAYDGWNLFGAAVVGALASIFALSVALYRRGDPYALPSLAFLCVAGTQLVFWLYTFPANRATRNWTTLPENWEMIRAHWEYSHAVSAVLTLLALILLCVHSIRA